MKKKAKPRPKPRPKARSAPKAARKSLRSTLAPPLPPKGVPAPPPAALFTRLGVIEDLLKRVIDRLTKVQPSEASTPVHIVLLNEGGERSHDPVLSKSQGDRVCWRNNGATARTLLFNLWPFVETGTKIVVPAGETSAAYTPKYDKPAGTVYSYTIDPEPTTTEGPPGGPEVITDD